MFSVGESGKRLWVAVNALFTTLVDLFLRTVYLFFFSTKRLIVAHRCDRRELFGAGASAEPKIAERMASSAADSSFSINEQRSNELIDAVFNKLRLPSVKCVDFDRNEDISQNVQTSKGNHLAAERDESSFIDAVFEKVKLPEVKFTDDNYRSSVDDDEKALRQVLPAEICSSQTEELSEEHFLKSTTLPGFTATTLTAANYDGDGGGSSTDIDELEEETAEDRSFEERIEEYFNEIVRESMRVADQAVMEETEEMRKPEDFVHNDVCSCDEFKKHDSSCRIELEETNNLRLIDENLGDTDVCRTTPLMDYKNQCYFNEDEYIYLSEAVVTAELEQHKSPIEDGTASPHVLATIDDNDGPTSKDALPLSPPPTDASSVSNAQNKQKDDKVSLNSKCSSSISSSNGGRGGAGGGGGMVEVRTQLHKKNNAFFCTQFEPDKQEQIRREIGSDMPSIRNIMDRYKRSVESGQNFRRTARPIDIFESLNDNESHPVVSDNHRSTAIEHPAKEKLHVKLAPSVTSGAEAVDDTAHSTYVKTPHPVALSSTRFTNGFTGSSFL